MILDFALLADSASASSEGKVDIRGGGISHITSANVPATVSALALVVRFLFEDKDRGVAHLMRIRVSLNGEEIVVSPPAEMSPEATQRRSPHPGERAAVVVVASLGQISFPAFGVYTIELLIDGQILASKNVSVSAGGTHTRRLIDTEIDDEPSA